MTTTSEEASLWGADGRLRDRELWLAWLRQNQANAAAAFDRLVSDGCDPDYLVEAIMELHARRDLGTIRKREVSSAYGHIQKAATSVRMLADSGLRYSLGEQPGQPELFRLLDVAEALEKIGRRLQSLIQVPSLGRESFGRVVTLLNLVTFVRWATGFYRDDDLDLIVQKILADDGWSTGRWRRDHQRPLANVRAKWGRQWDEQATRGELLAPTRRGQRRRSGRPRAKPKLIARRDR